MDWKISLSVIILTALTSCAHEQKRVNDGVACFTSYTSGFTICGAVTVWRDQRDIIFRMDKDSILHPPRGVDQ